MPHDATPPIGRRREFGVPGWFVALALAVALSAAVLVVITGAFVILVPALAAVALAYGLYVVIAARRRSSRFGFSAQLRRLGVIEDRSLLRRPPPLRRALIPPQSGCGARHPAPLNRRHAHPL